MADPKTILCIDDDQDFLEALSVLLKANGYNVVTACSAEQGLKVYEQTRPDLVIVDLMMEEVDAGTGFVKEVKLRGGDVPIYMLSSVGDNLSMATDYSSLGLSGVFQKPVNHENLLRVLKARLK